MATHQDSIDNYLKDISHIPTMKPQDERALIEKIKGGDEAAKWKLITSNLRLVVKISNSYKGFGVPLPELISEGNLGLINAVKKYDPTKGAKFSTYAAWWIKCEIRKNLLKHCKVLNMPSTVAYLIMKVKSTHATLEEQLGREPTDAEIGKALKLTARAVSRLKRSEPKVTSLQEDVGTGDNTQFTDICPDDRAITPDEILNEIDRLELLKKLLDNLDSRERSIIQMRYGLNGKAPKTLDEVSKRFKCTRERVRQIQRDALMKLRRLINESESLDLRHHYN